jgi:glutathione S-transferase
MEVLSPLVGHEARTLTGLHLYHYGLSSCSQKVRVVLAEKQLGWTSHHLDLLKGEHATDAYRHINPNGVVPTLVHDGTIVIESSDIMEHLDDHFPDPPLRPLDEAAFAQVRPWVARQDSIQRAVDVLSHAYLFRVLGERAAMPSKMTIAAAVHTIDEALGEVNRHLAAREWLVGRAFSVADVAWAVAVHRLTVIWFPLMQYRDLRTWYRRVRQRPSFQQGVVSYEPSDLRRRVALDAFRCWLTRSNLGATKWHNARLLAH